MKKILLTKESLKLGKNLGNNICEFEERLTNGIDYEDLKFFLRVIDMLPKNIEE